MLESTELKIHCLSGASVLEHIDSVAALHVQVFREFPYLYDRHVDFEAKLMSVYFANAESPLFVLAYDGTKLVGAATARALCNKFRTDGVEQLFLANNLDPATFYFLADSVLLPAYRGQGTGKVFFRERERYARMSGFSNCCFCAVQRSIQHPQAPTDYRPLAQFWNRLGYEERPELEIEFTWRDVGASRATTKVMRYWVKSL